MINLNNIDNVNWGNTKIAILGAGISGIGAAKLAMHFKAQILLSDVQKTNLDILENDKFQYESSGHSNRILESDLIIKSPGIPNEINIIKRSQEKNIPIVSEIEFASWFSNSDIIAITGSNGKTTTVNLVFEIFKKFTKNILLGGNIGTSYSENVLHEIKSKKKFIHILEVSSYQAEHLYHFSPKISCILNISEDHMDRYQNIDQYISAKLNISKNLTAKTKLIYNYDDKKLSRKITPKNNIISFSANKKNIIKYNSNGTLELQKKKYRFSTSLIGMHNFYNILAAIEIAKLYKIDLMDIVKTIKDFRPLPHRIEFIGSYNGVQYINDSKSTTIASTIAAIECLNNIVLILGGKEKGTINKIELLKCINHPNVASVIIYGDVGLILKNKLADYDLSNNSIEFCYSFKEAVNKSIDLSFPNSSILLSPGFSSFDQFNNYKDRGNAFKKIIIEAEHG